MSKPKPEYDSYRNMIDRCENPKHPYYHNYGGRGITICPEWRASFEQFLADMGPKPTPSHTIERDDSDRPYCPSNCRWATRTEQARNRRSNRLITFCGETKTLQEWADQYGLNHACLLRRLNRGWSVEKALTTPSVLPGHPRERTHCPQGHPYDEENTLYKVRKGRGVERHCRQCIREYKRRKYAQRLERA